MHALDNLTVKVRSHDWSRIGLQKSLLPLQLRASSFALFVAYVRKYHGDVAVVPIDEELVYRYIDFLRS